MKKIIIFVLTLLVLSPCLAYAKVLTPTDSPTPSTSASPSAAATIDAQINKLKDQIASRVAQLKLVEKRGIIGTVTDSSNNQITVTDSHGNIRYVQVDELTKFNNPNTKGTFGISDMTKGMYISVLGLYNKEDRKILARFIDVVSYPKVITGAITSVDKANYLIHVASVDQKDIPVDIETFTKMYTYTKANGMTKVGFSKIKENQRVTVIGFNDKNNKTHILASRFIIFPELQVNPKISTSGTSSITASPSASISVPKIPSPTSTKKYK